MEIQFTSFKDAGGFTKASRRESEARPRPSSQCCCWGSVSPRRRTRSGRWHRRASSFFPATLGPPLGALPLPLGPFAATPAPPPAAAPLRLASAAASQDQVARSDLSAEATLELLQLPDPCLGLVSPALPLLGLHHRIWGGTGAAPAPSSPRRGRPRPPPPPGPVPRRRLFSGRAPSPRRGGW
jgi:hypothetical protein